MSKSVRRGETWRPNRCCSGAQYRLSGVPQGPGIRTTGRGSKPKERSTGTRATAKTARRPHRGPDPAPAPPHGALRAAEPSGLGRGTNLNTGRSRPGISIRTGSPRRRESGSRSPVPGDQPARWARTNGVFLGSKDGARSNTAKAIEYYLSWRPAFAPQCLSPGSAAMLSAARNWANSWSFQDALSAAATASAETGGLGVHGSVVVPPRRRSAAMGFLFRVKTPEMRRFSSVIHLAGGHGNA